MARALAWSRPLPPRYETVIQAFPALFKHAMRAYGGGPDDAFIVKLNATGSAALYATLLGGSGTDQAQSLALDPAGNVCVAGYTNSTDLPTLAAVQPNPGGEG